MACGCPSTLPAVTSDYEPKGDYEDIAGLKTYVTGPPDATKAILVIYDIFGLHNSTLQGTDRLSQHTGALVLVPDVFKGEPLPIDAYPPDTEDKQKVIQAWRSKSMDLPSHIANVEKVIEATTAKRSITTWGTFGLCFGGILTSMMSGEGTKAKASGTAHPGRPTPEIARKITIPYICLFSKDDGDPAVVAEYGDILKGKPGCVVEHYTEMHHGWMAARANLKDEANIKEFARGWSQVGDFFLNEL